MWILAGNSYQLSYTDVHAVTTVRNGQTDSSQSLHLKRRTMRNRLWAQTISLRRQRGLFCGRLPFSVSVGFPHLVGCGVWHRVHNTDSPSAQAFCHWRFKCGSVYPGIIWPRKSRTVSTLNTHVKLDLGFLRFMLHVNNLLRCTRGDLGCMHSLCQYQIVPL